MVIYDIEIIFHLTNKTTMKRQHIRVHSSSFGLGIPRQKIMRTDQSSASMITNDVSEQKLLEMQTQTPRYMMQK